MIACAFAEPGLRPRHAELWEIALRETVWNCGFRFAPDVSLACRKLGIAEPEITRRFAEDGERFVAYGFAWPEDAVSFLAHFARLGFGARVSMSAEEIFERLGEQPDRDDPLRSSSLS